MSYYYQYLFEKTDDNPQGEKAKGISQQNYNEFKYDELKLEDKIKYIGFALQDINVNSKVERNSDDDIDVDFVLLVKNDKDARKARELIQKINGDIKDSNIFKLDNKLFYIKSQETKKQNRFTDTLTRAREIQDAAARRFQDMTTVRQYRYV